jgi:integrase
LAILRRSGRSARRRTNARNLLRAINAASVRCGLLADGQEKVGLHDLRHSLAGYAFSQKLSAVEVSKLLRHANALVTQTTYAGLAPSAALAAGDKLAAGLGG